MQALRPPAKPEEWSQRISFRARTMSWPIFWKDRRFDRTTQVVAVNDSEFSGSERVRVIAWTWPAPRGSMAASNLGPLFGNQHWIADLPEFLTKGPDEDVRLLAEQQPELAKTR